MARGLKSFTKNSNFIKAKSAAYRTFFVPLNFGKVKTQKNEQNIKKCSFLNYFIYRVLTKKSNLGIITLLNRGGANKPPLKENFYEESI